MFFTQKIVKKPHFTVALTVILKSKSIKNFLSYESQKIVKKVLVLKVKSDFVNDDPKIFKTVFNTASLTTAILHRFDNRGFNGEFKNCIFKTRRFT